MYWGYYPARSTLRGSCGELVTVNAKEQKGGTFAVEDA